MEKGKTRALCRELANKLAEHLTELNLIELGPKKWKGHVWENLGWHYNAISPCGRWKVHPHHKRGDITKKVESFTAFLGEKRSPGGYYAESGKTAREAVVATAKKAYEDVVWRAKLLDLPVPPRKFV